MALDELNKVVLVVMFCLIALEDSTVIKLKERVFVLYLFMLYYRTCEYHFTPELS